MGSNNRNARQEAMARTLERHELQRNQLTVRAEELSRTLEILGRPVTAEEVIHTHLLTIVRLVSGGNVVRESKAHVELLEDLVKYLEDKEAGGNAHG